MYKHVRRIKFQLELLDLCLHYTNSCPSPRSACRTCRDAYDFVARCALTESRLAGLRHSVHRRRLAQVRSRAQTQAALSVCPRSVRTPASSSTGRSLRPYFALLRCFLPPCSSSVRSRRTAPLCASLEESLRAAAHILACDSRATTTRRRALVNLLVLVHSTRWRRWDGGRNFGNVPAPCNGQTTRSFPRSPSARPRCAGRLSPSIRRSRCGLELLEPRARNRDRSASTTRARILQTRPSPDRRQAGGRVGREPHGALAGHTCSPQHFVASPGGGISERCSREGKDMLRAWIHLGVPRRIRNVFN
ncbi:hypothetical protein B0H15DRAFT_817622 [Mycena belliarum]|uniref:Uncharacterized protein n=1 Tax=Mycena belliarum TaxID=1033014 RepID=A0AAD6UJI8_9AGAR|nr:hypothetical protein B0H15DRAFT_817622 [Mycena belliae]